MKAYFLEAFSNREDFIKFLAFMLSESDSFSWHFRAHGVGIYPDGRIDWDYSTAGQFTDFQLEGTE